MHFSKTYTRLLETLPPELRENAISYRKLKKLINQVVQELSVLGFTPALLHNLLQQGNETLREMQSTGGDRQISVVVEPALAEPLPYKIIYEINGEHGQLEPQLKVSLVGDADPTSLLPLTSLISGYSHPPQTQLNSRELVIPLVSDIAFFELLNNALDTISSHLTTVHSNFLASLNSLSRSISEHAKPMSSTDRARFKPHSQTADPGIIDVPAMKSLFHARAKTDLYVWRQIFQFYIEAEIFEGTEERRRGDRTPEEAQQRLTQFLERLRQSRLFYTNEGNSKHTTSHQDIQSFIELITLILDLKKFHYANTEAARKILKKHSKRTALPLPPAVSVDITSHLGTISTKRTTVVSSDALTSGSAQYIALPRLLVQAIGEVLVPIIPHVDDYACLICTSIAFKPIRLKCNHLFCVRCLVKMQKRGNGNCPMCRAPTVLSADRTNVDWALLNFMKDWFPIESREKLLTNEKEAAKEEAEELGVGEGCIIF